MALLSPTFRQRLRGEARTSIARWRASGSSRLVLVGAAALGVPALLLGGPAGDPAPRSRLAPFAIETSLLRSGDLLFRRGEGVASETVLHADPSSAYSHVGIVHLGESGPVVVHAAPGPLLAGRTLVQATPLDAFADRAAARAITVRRLDDPSIARRAAEIALSYVRQRVIFDAAFDLESEAAMYCTELVWRAFLASGLDLVGDAFDELSFPFADGLYILPSRLLRNPRFEEVLTLDSQTEDQHG